MNWHTRYLQQANWTRSLRHYVFEQAGLNTASRVLEVGCGTGAILREMNTPAALHGLDLDPFALTECRTHAPAASLIYGDANALPYPEKSFDIVFCHFLLLWVDNPVQVVCEMARVGRSVLALAEPDYGHRVDEPVELRTLGEWQTQSLMRRGANPLFGGLLAETFFQAGIEIIESGPIQTSEEKRSKKDWEDEWEVFQADLADEVPPEEIQKMKTLHEEACRRGGRRLHIPTYFAWGNT